MALTGTTFMERSHHVSSGCVGGAIAALLRQRYPFHTAKQVARDLGPAVQVKTAENLLAGHLSARSLAMILRAYGPDLLIDATLLAADSSLDNFIRQKARNAEQERARWESETRRFTELQAELLTRCPGDMARRPGRARGMAERLG